MAIRLSRTMAWTSAMNAPNERTTNHSQRKQQPTAEHRDTPVTIDLTT